MHRALALALSLLAAGCARPLVKELPDVHYGVGDPEFARSVTGLVGMPLIPGNRVRALVSADEIVPEMLAAIERARRSVTLETYVWWDSPVASIFADALAERALSGVRVHVLVDDFGDSMGRAAERRLRAAGVELQRFHPILAGLLDGRRDPNNRTHRRVLVIDGRVAFTGGVGIAQEWLHDPERPGGGWRDTQFVVEGPVVAQLQAVFAENWLDATGRLLEGDLYFPRLAPAGETLVQACASSPEGRRSLRASFLLALAAARRSVLLMNAYFIPDEITTEALVACARRGVRVQVIVPGEQTDLPIVRRASRARWGPLLEAGVEIYEFLPTMYHCKVMVVDDLWVSGGTGNLDPRSFHLNEEININVLDASVAAEQRRVFEADLRRSRRITYETWEARSTLDRMLDRAASWFGAAM